MSQALCKNQPLSRNRNGAAPQTRLVLMVGLMDKDRPVQANRARRWATIQSTEPLRFTTAKEVVGDRTETRAVTGLAEETCILISVCLAI